MSEVIGLYILQIIRRKLRTKINSRSTFISQDRNLTLCFYVYIYIYICTGDVVIWRRNLPEDINIAVRI